MLMPFFSFLELSSNNYKPPPHQKTNKQTVTLANVICSGMFYPFCLLFVDMSTTAYDFKFNLLRSCYFWYHITLETDSITSKEKVSIIMTLSVEALNHFLEEMFLCKVLYVNIESIYIKMCYKLYYQKYNLNYMVVFIMTSYFLPN